MQLVQVIKKQVKVNGMDKTCVVSIEVETDDFQQDDYMERDLMLETMRRLHRGELGCHWVKVTARFSELEHFEGVDSLGQVLSSSKAELLAVVKDHDMVGTAIAALKENVFAGKSQIDAFLGKVA